MHFDDADDYWNLQTEVSGPLALFIAALPTDEQAAVRGSLLPMLERFATKDGFGMPTLAIGVAAVAP
jgi:hypothetical protein